MPLSQLNLLLLVIGAVWAFVGFVNVLVLIVLDRGPLLGWWQAITIAVVVALSLGLVTWHSVAAAKRRAEPAAGLLFAAPSQTVGRCVGPALMALVLLLVLSIVPDGEPYRGLAALMLLALGGSYLPLAIWLRRFEEMHGVIVVQPINRYGVRTGAIRVLQLPR